MLVITTTGVFFTEILRYFKLVNNVFLSLDYYDSWLLLKYLKGFIVQTGDPTGTGKGGTSIWGKKFDDEFKEELKVCLAYAKIRLR